MTGRPEMMVSPTGARLSKQDHPALPISLEEITASALACFQAGASSLHLHIRDARGRHSLDAGRYREALAGLAVQVPQMGVQITTEAAGIFSPAQQLACLQSLQPGWASVAVREIDEATAARLYGFCAEAGIRLQHIVYDRADLALLQQRRSAGVVAASQNELIFVLGSYGAQRHGRPEELRPLVDAAGQGLRWSLCAFGPAEQACLLHAAGLGAASLRVGFENNLHQPDGRLWQSVEAAVAALAAALKARSEDAGG